MRLADYIASLIVTQGAGAGQPFRVLPWQARFLRGFTRTDGDCALSIARGAGKTTFTAAIATAAIDGPLAQPRAEAVIVASSFSQARIGFEHVLAFLAARGHDLDDRKRWRRQDSQNSATIEDRRTGSRVRCVGSDPARAHGLAPVLVLADEPSQWPSTTSERMRVALSTSMGKVEDSRLIALGTRPADPAHWFVTMLAGGCDYAQSHHARESDPPFRYRTWLRANPSLPIMPALERRIRQEAADARRDPSLLAGFLALRLNRGIDDTLQDTLLDASVWRDAEGDVEPRGPYVLGVDLGGSASMSAAAGYWPAGGRVAALGCFPQQPDLATRGLRDGCGRAYLDMHRRDELILRGGRVADVPGLLREVLARWGRPACIACDRWRINELRDALDAAGVPRVPLIERGQGFKDGGEDTADFRTATLGGRVRPVPSLLLRSAMAAARVTMDAAGNAKIIKTRSRARIDAASAAVLAVAVGERRARTSPRRPLRSAVVG